MFHIKKFENSKKFARISIALLLIASAFVAYTPISTGKITFVTIVNFTLVGLGFWLHNKHKFLVHRDLFMSTLETSNEYYELVDTEIVREYTYYFDDESHCYVVEYRMNNAEAKIIKLNAFEKFDFFSTVKDYQPIMVVKHYRLHEDVKEWRKNNPSYLLPLQNKRVIGELKFEDIYKNEKE